MTALYRKATVGNAMKALLAALMFSMPALARPLEVAHPFVLPPDRIHRDANVVATHPLQPGYVVFGPNFALPGSVGTPTRVAFGERRFFVSSVAAARVLSDGSLPAVHLDFAGSARYPWASFLSSSGLSLFGVPIGRSNPNSLAIGDDGAVYLQYADDLISIDDGTVRSFRPAMSPQRYSMDDVQAEQDHLFVVGDETFENSRFVWLGKFTRSGQVVWQSRVPDTSNINASSRVWVNGNSIVVAYYSISQQFVGAQVFDLNGQPIGVALQRFPGSEVSEVKADEDQVFVRSGSDLIRWSTDGSAAGHFQVPGEVVSMDIATNGKLFVTSFDRNAAAGRLSRYGSTLESSIVLPSAFMISKMAVDFGNHVILAARDGDFGPLRVAEYTQGLELVRSYDALGVPNAATIGAGVVGTNACGIIRRRDGRGSFVVAMDRERGSEEWRVSVSDEAVALASAAGVWVVSGESAVLYDHHGQATTAATLPGALPLPLGRYQASSNGGVDSFSSTASSCVRSNASPAGSVQESTYAVPCEALKFAPDGRAAGGYLGQIRSFSPSGQLLWMVPGGDAVVAVRTDGILVERTPDLPNQTRRFRKLSSTGEQIYSLELPASTGACYVLTSSLRCLDDQAGARVVSSFRLTDGGQLGAAFAIPIDGAQEIVPVIGNDDSLWLGQGTQNGYAAVEIGMTGFKQFQSSFPSGGNGSYFFTEVTQAWRNSSGAVLGLAHSPIDFGTERAIVLRAGSELFANGFED